MAEPKYNCYRLIEPSDRRANYGTLRTTLEKDKIEKILDLVREKEAYNTDDLLEIVRCLDDTAEILREQFIEF